jgi:predicted metal-dependent hydrolase
MSDLHVRKPAFDFSGVAFLWNPSQPAFSVAMNAMSFWVIGLERYLVRVVKDAERVITDPALREEARLFMQQEAVHSKTHRQHVKALIEQHPGLAGAIDSVVAHYDELYEAKDLRYHLAYAAALEGTFTSVFGGPIEHREALFRDGDARVASLCLWHFCEEIEHRSSAVKIYDHVVADRGLHRLQVLPSLVGHVDAGFDQLYREFKANVPGEAGAAHYGSSRASRLLGRRANPLAAVPVPNRIRLVLRAMASVLPTFDHDGQQIPAWCDTWFWNHEQGTDMATFYGRLVGDAQHS